MSPSEPNVVVATGDIPTADASIGEFATVQIFQFCGLLWLTEYNASKAGIENGLDSQTLYGMNTILSAYAALEALVTETAFCVEPELYAKKKEFRKQGLSQKFRLLIDKLGRTEECLPDVIDEISAHRIALTHSEPDNIRSSQIGSVVSGTDANRFATEVRNLANWLWQGARPSPVAYSFDSPNVFLVGNAPGVR